MHVSHALFEAVALGGIAFRFPVAYAIAEGALHLLVAVQLLVVRVFVWVCSEEMALRFCRQQFEELIRHWHLFLVVLLHHACKCK